MNNHNELDLPTLNSQTIAPPISPRKAYIQPKLKRLGNLHSLTMGGSGDVDDSIAGFMFRI